MFTIKLMNLMKLDSGVAIFIFSLTINSSTYIYNLHVLFNVRLHVYLLANYVSSEKNTWLSN